MNIIEYVLGKFVKKRKIKKSNPPTTKKKKNFKGENEIWNTFDEESHLKF